MANESARRRTVAAMVLVIVLVTSASTGVTAIEPRPGRDGSSPGTHGATGGLRVSSAGPVGVVASTGPDGTATPEQADGDVDGTGEVSSAKIVHPVDRDGDGYVSGFGIEIVSDTRPLNPEKHAKESRFNEITKKVFSRILGVPTTPLFKLFGKTYDYFFVPGQRLTVVTRDGTRELGPIYPVSPGKYLGPGSEDYRMTYVVGTAASDMAWTHESQHATVEQFTGAGNQRTTLTGSTLTTCWKLETRGLAYSNIDCIDPSRDLPADLRKGFSSLYGEGTYVLDYDQPLKVESPAMDRKEQMTVTANVDGAGVWINRKRVGTTPWTGSVPVDVARDHPAEVSVGKVGYVGSTTRISAPRDVDATVKKVKKPITVRTKTPGATVSIDGQTVGTTPWSGYRWVGKTYEVIVNADGKLPHRFTDVKAGETISTELVNDSLLGAIGTPTVDGTLFGGSGGTTTTTTDSGTQQNVTDASTFDTSLIITGSTSLARSDLLDLTSQLQNVELVEARFTGQPTTVRVGEAVDFDAAQSYSLMGTVASYRWDFGDGSSTGALVSSQRTHAFANPGTYTVELEVTDSEGNTAARTRAITVEDASPTARFAPSSFDPRPGVSVTFDASGSADAEGPISAYQWHFGDGTTATGPQVTHAFGGEGSYTVGLTVTDAGGNTASATKTIDVHRPNERPTAAFSYRVDSTNYRVTVDAGSSTDPDGSIQYYRWFFQNGTTGTGTTVTHQYPSDGKKNIMLMVVDDDGTADVVGRDVDLRSSTSGATESAGATSRTTTEAGSSGTASATTSAPLPGTTSSGAAQSPAETSSSGQPGFGPVSALLAIVVLLGAVGFRRRRY